MFGRFTCDFYESLPIPPNPTYRKSLASKFLDPLNSGDDIPAEVVWDIVCRWQGIRVLYDLYCDSVVNEAYLASTFPHITDVVDMPDTTEAMAAESALAYPSGFVCASFQEASQMERQRSYQRFYKAVTRHWISVETLWLVRTQPLPNAKEFDRAFERTWQTWSHNPTRPASDKIDIIEVVDFVWGFLGRKAFHISSLPDWLEGLGEDVFDEYMDDNETEIANWGFFVRSIFQYLRPPHVIELLLWMWNPSRWNFDRPGFLRRLGLLDTWQGFQKDDSDISYADNWVPITIMEEDIVSSLTHTQDAATLASRWEEYRYNRWPLDAKARVFFRGSTTEELFTRIASTTTN